MTKKPFLLAVEFVALSVPLTWLWIEWGREAYPQLFLKVVTPILPSVRPSHLPDRFVNYVPFLLLMVITPGMGLVRRVVGTAAGFALIFLTHVAFTWFAIAIDRYPELASRPFRSIFPAFILLDAFPIALWAILAADFLRELMSGARRKAPAEPTRRA